MQLSQSSREVDIIPAPLRNQSPFILLAGLKIAQLACEVCRGQMGRLDRLNRRPVFRPCDHDRPLWAENASSGRLIFQPLRYPTYRPARGLDPAQQV
jgi:hypothetical protein